MTPEEAVSKIPCHAKIKAFCNNNPSEVYTVEDISKTLDIPRKNITDAFHQTGGIASLKGYSVIISKNYRIVGHPSSIERYKQILKEEHGVEL
jgi:hypothetical protein